MLNNHREVGSYTLETQRGFSLIEVLVTLVIVAVGLLGLAGMQARALVAEQESYGRSQALVLLQDIVQRSEANPVGSKTWIAAPVNISNLGASDYVCSTANQLSKDLCEWDAAIKATPALQIARGCIETIAASREVLFSVAWRGRDNGFAPSGTQTCGSAAITTGRRVVSTRIRVPSLGS